MSRIGFIGVGIMGGPMAGHLQAGGHELYLVKHRSALPQALLDSGARECASCKEVAEQADVVIVMVPDTPDVASVLFSDQGVAAGLSAGKTVIDMSSISPIETKDFAARINALGCDYVDAPVSGGEVGAKSAALTIMVGASERVFESVKALESFNACAAHGWDELARIFHQGSQWLARNGLICQNLCATLQQISALQSVFRHRLTPALAGPCAFELGLHLTHSYGYGLGSSPALKHTCPSPSSGVPDEISGLDHSAMVRALEVAANHAIE